MTEGEPLLDTLDRELADCRRQLEGLVERTDALTELWQRATTIQAELKHRHVELADVKRGAIAQGEEERARFAALIARISRGDTEDA